MVVIRLSRAGAKKRPFYHICVSDRRNKRDGRFIERIGFYNPIAKDSEEKIRFDNERYDHWTSVGAIPSDTVLMLMKRSKMTEEEIELYRWINACPEAALSYKEKDGTIIIPEILRPYMNNKKFIR